MWKCEKCGKCCEFIVIPVAEELDAETEEYLLSHGIVYDGKKVVIPARCQYLTSKNECAIHTAKFANCRLAGKKECMEAKRLWCLLNPN